MVPSRTRLVALALAAATGLSLLSQPNGKRPLSHSDYDTWKAVVGQRLSPDGRFVAYGLFPQEGDGEIVVREIASGKEHRIPAGQRPIDPLPASDEPGEGPPQQRVPRIVISADSRHVAAETYPPKAEQDKARGRRAEEQPKNGLAILDVASGAVTRVDSVKAFQLPEDAGGWIAYQKEPPAARTERESGTPRPAPAGRRAATPSDVVLRNLSAGAERTLAAVLEFGFDRKGGRLAYLDANGAHLLATASDGAAQTLVSGQARYSKLAWSRDGTKLAFYRDRSVFVWRGGDTAAEAVGPSQAGLPAGFQPSDNGTLAFSRDGSRLFFGAAPRRAQAEAKPAQDAPPKAVFDLWHWQDDFARTIQKARAARERNRTYRSVLHLASNKVTPLADLTLPEVNPGGDGRYAIGLDDRAYRPMVEYDTSYSDAYIVDTETGARTLFHRKLRSGGGGGGQGPGGGPVSWSPTGRQAVFFDGKDWHSVDAVTGSVANLTSRLGVNFFNEQSDVPATPGSYGNGGWSRDGNWILLNDRHDVWQVSPDGSKAVNLTDGEGRKQGLQFRAVRLENDPDEPGIDGSKPLLLRAEHLKTRDSGFFRDAISGAAAPQRLLMGPVNYSNPVKAKNAGVYLLTASTFSDFPDLRVTDETFRDLRKLSDANPQQKGLLWGKTELISFRNTDGVPLQAVLVKPENFDPQKKHPLLVYIYERLSDTVHNFQNPRPGHSIVPSFYASRGYLVLMPDIVYTTGFPGQSAMKCVLPAIDRVVDGGYVDEKAIGIQGHSWGGYQISYMVTQTKRFRAAAAGAPVGNMTSAYNGIRYGPGLPRQFQYEKAQSRIGGSLWEYPERFLENSPVFMADRIGTPLLLLHNDADDAVPFTQGIELFLSLRRLGKEAYLFNYNGEPHGLRKRANQKDYTERLQQFFDHYLKGEARPTWMEKPAQRIE
ncbi:MAG: prolyl oligopeptidase family serine peptidase [Bryobacteraceae bacterium]|nr:prolyl oligopeptidase family serine peptidase [Bryobacteraceae bacterium]